MTYIPITALNSLHRAHFEGGGRIKPVAEYGCYYCGDIHRVDEYPIVKWVDGGKTALCGRCGIDAVIPRIKGIAFTKYDMERLCKKMF